MSAEIRNLTEPYEMEKYVAPGALSVFLFWILPRLLLAGLTSTSSSVADELAVLIVVAYAVGHLLEALKLYNWPTKSKHEFDIFRTKVKSLLDFEKVKNGQAQEERARALLFTVVGASDRSELSWNLVRWQKMMVFYCLIRGFAGLWICVMILSILENYVGFHLVSSSVRIVVLDPSLPFLVMLAFEALVLAASIWIAHKMLKNGVERQVKNNEAQFELMVKHFAEIKKILDSRAQISQSQPAPQT